MSRNGLPDQPALRRRLRAARALQDVSFAELASRLDASWKLSERTLRKLESGESEITERQLRPIAEALSVPYEWLVTADPFAPWQTRDATLERAFETRLAALEARLAELDPQGGPAPAPPAREQRSRAESGQASGQ